MQTLSGNQHLDLITSLMNMFRVLRLPHKMYLCRSSSNAPRLPSFLEMPQNPHVLLTFDTVHNPLRLPRETKSERPKVLRPPHFFTLLTSKCASHQTDVRLLDISTSKSGPNMRCFVHFDLEMCFAPQRRALFGHLNFQKWSEHEVLNMLTWKCASRHNDVHLLDISTSKSGPNMRCFIHFDLEMCFAPQRRAFLDISTCKSGPNMRCFEHFDLEMCFAPQRRATFHLSSGQMAPNPPL